MAFLGLPTKQQKAAKRETARNIVSPSAPAPSITSTGPSDPPQEAALKIKVSLVDEMWGMGTPEELNNFLTHYKA